MIEEYWGLKEKPFSNTPDTRFLYRTGEFEEALARLLYNIKEIGGGLTVITGEIGSGKTFLAFALMEKLKEEGYPVALITNPTFSPTGLLREMAYSFGLEKVPRYRMQILKLLREFLEKNGKVGVLIIDEAQILKPSLLEEIRLLLNLETPKTKLLQIVLFGQPELKKKINRMPQVRQRINVRYHLGPMDEEETEGYILHRLKVAGCTRRIFTVDAIKEIHRYSGGIPRVVNNLAQNALFVGYVQEKNEIDAEIIKDVAADLEMEEEERRRKGR
ncbi:ATPase [bacterium]|nr:MAG: ATPase [bacterium]